ncbi:MAG TPA: glycosyltransferase family 2 protein [Candidatus Krumholzibacteria bacterium]|nr:glycosyltransferase family 2 protein [Candidatus Krumholzibacteria bacterium]
MSHDSDQNRFDVSVVIPAFNEEAAIGQTLDEILAALAGSTRRYEILVVDDGSSDRTGAEAATRNHVRVITHRRNRGYGAALKSGVLASRAEIVLFYDADNQFEPVDIERMVNELSDHDAALGARTSASHAPFSRRGGKKALGWLANYLARTRIPDLNCGLRAIRRDLLLDYLHLLPNGFSASTTTTLVLLKEGHDVRFVPVVVKKRIGKSTVKPLKDGMDTALLVVRLTTLLDPFRVFGPVSGVFFLFGVGLGVHYISLGRGLSTASLFLLVSSIIIFFFGLLADQVASLRRERRYSDHR